MRIGILFDLDGTLLDTLQDLADSVNDTLRHFSCPERTLEEVRAFVGNGAENLIRRALPGKADDPDGKEVLAFFQRYYKEHCQDATAPYAGIPEALEELRKRYPLAVVSNKPDGAVKALCDHYFPGIYARGEDRDCPRKPAPDMLFKTMAVLNVDTCVYVGDSEVDVVTARNANVPCLSVTWGFRDRAEMEAVGGAHFCEDPYQLAQAVDALVRQCKDLTIE